MSTATTEPQPGLSRLLRPTRLLAYVFYGLLLASVVATLTGLPALEQAVRGGRLPRGMLIIPSVLLGLFIALFAAYRYVLVKAGRYRAGTAYAQVGLMVLMATLLLPRSIERYRQSGEGEGLAAAAAGNTDLSRALSSQEPEERALAAELARYRPRQDALRYVSQLLRLLGDPADEVRRQAHATLVALAGGRDPGGEGLDAQARWRAFWKERGADLAGE